MCSNKCANPLLPGTSSPEPTWYQTLTATSGMLGSGARITSSPFGSLYFSNGIFGSSACARCGVATRANVNRARFMGRNVAPAVITIQRGGDGTPLADRFGRVLLLRGPG